jgi:V-type H+-transporting ATPase subunit H
MNRKYHIVPILRDIAKSAIKEKVVRVIVATFKNMLIKASEDTMIPMLGYKILSSIEVLSVRKWSDEEIVEDMNWLRDELGKHVAQLS